MQDFRPRHDWSRRAGRSAVRATLQRPDLPGPVRTPPWQQPNSVQMSTLLSIKTGACPKTAPTVRRACATTPGSCGEALMAVAQVVETARAARGRRRHPLLHGRGLSLAKAARSRTDHRRWSRAVRELGLETCATLGMLDAGAGRGTRRTPDSITTTTTSIPPRSIYSEIISTRSYQDRLDTLEAVREAGHARVLRRHHRHGRVRVIASRCCVPWRHLPQHPGERAHQPASAAWPARRCADAGPVGSVRFRAHHRGGARA